MPEPLKFEWMFLLKDKATGKYVNAVKHNGKETGPMKPGDPPRYTVTGWADTWEFGFRFYQFWDVKRWIEWLQLPNVVIVKRPMQEDWPSVPSGPAGPAWLKRKREEESS